ncbi:MAG: polyprenyl synthetase family protein [Candidatus Hydrogenedentes bacterium]|nr:polyprenyl synthetase family protein [Candidatus Hydrogenedentota bacterium]
MREVVCEIWHDALTLVSTTDANSNKQQAKGKLLRPALCLLGAGALGKKDISQYARLAAAYELMHIASLTHDDVVDHASLRRGQNSLNTLWDNHAAILGGDYLVARALELLTEYDSRPLIVSVLQSMQRMAEGELRYFGQDFIHAGEADCIALADSKTASLFAASCTAPASLFAPDQVPVLHEFGIGLGIAFQLLDDLLDITQSEDVLGKPACGDVTEGKHTLPLHLLRIAMTPDERERLAALTGNTLSVIEQQWVWETVQRLGVDKMTVARATQYIDQALAAIAPLPDSSYKKSMITLAQFVLVRQA